MDEKKERGSQGKLGPRWMKQTLQVPKTIGQDFRGHASTIGTGGVKVLGSLGIGLVNGMPDEVRRELASFVNAKTWQSADGLDEEMLWKFFLHLLSVHGVQLPAIDERETKSGPKQSRQNKM